MIGKVLNLMECKDFRIVCSSPKEQSCFTHQFNFYKIIFKLLTQNESNMQTYPQRAFFKIGIKIIEFHSFFFVLFKKI